MGCKKLQGKIYTPDLFDPIEPPLHELCRCFLRWMDAVMAGNATKNRYSGADWWLKTYDHLPEYYITEEEARSMGWIPLLANLGIVAKGKMLKKESIKTETDIYPKLPAAFGMRRTSIMPAGIGELTAFYIPAMA